jgi:hypothetical protein
MAIAVAARIPMIRRLLFTWGMSFRWGVRQSWGAT